LPERGQQSKRPWKIQIVNARFFRAENSVRLKFREQLVKYPDKFAFSSNAEYP
jgi:hypothetical protein